MLYEQNWTQLVHEQLRRFETNVVAAAKLEGYDGKDVFDAERQWSFSGALLYSVTVITTIGNFFLKQIFNYRLGSKSGLRNFFKFFDMKFFLKHFPCFNMFFLPDFAFSVNFKFSVQARISSNFKSFLTVK